MCSEEEGEADHWYSPEEEDLYEEYILGLEDEESSPSFLAQEREAAALGLVFEDQTEDNESLVEEVDEDIFDKVSLTHLFHKTQRKHS